MLKASVSDTVLALLVHTSGRGVARRVVCRTCSRLLCRSSSFSAPRHVASSASAPSLALAPQRNSFSRTHKGNLSDLESHPQPAAHPPGSEMVGGSEDLDGQEKAVEDLDLYGRLRANHLRHVSQTKAKSRLARLHATSANLERRTRTALYNPSKESESTKSQDYTENGKCVTPSSPARSTRLGRAGAQSMSRNPLASKLSPRLNVLNESSPGTELRCDSILDMRRIILSASSTLEEAWNAYQHLVEHDTAPDGNIDSIHNLGAVRPENPAIDEYLLANLARRVGQTKPPTRENFLRLLAVLARLRRDREQHGVYPSLRTREWNALIHFAGSGLRCTRLEDYNTALDVFGDMIGSPDHADKEVEKVFDSERNAGIVRKAEPDIHTYTTLLNIAVKTGHLPAVHHAQQLLKSSGLKPIRITYLCAIRHHLQTKGLSGVRDVLSALVEENYEVGIDGVGAFLYSAGLEGRLDVVRNVYAALRQNLRTAEKEAMMLDKVGHETETSREDTATGGVKDTVTVEGITFSKSVVPDEALYTFTIQTFAYHGCIGEALQVFTEMLSTRRSAPETGFFQPSYAVFRAFFLSYSKHGLHQDNMPAFARRLYARQTDWNWERLQVLLDAFFELEDCHPTERVIYWMMESARRTTENEELLRDLWTRLTTRFSFRKGGRLRRLDRAYGNPQKDSERVESPVKEP